MIIQILQRLIRIALEEPNEDLRRFASYQHVIWNHDADCQSAWRTYSYSYMFFTRWFQFLPVLSLRWRPNGLKPYGIQNQEKWYVVRIRVAFPNDAPIFRMSVDHISSSAQLTFLVSLKRGMILCSVCLPFLTLFTVKLSESRWHRSRITGSWSSVISD